MGVACTVGTRPLLWASVGAGAALVLMGSEPQAMEPADDPAELAAMQRRLERLEKQLEATEVDAAARIADLERQLAQHDPVEHWEEAVRLGVVRELSRHRTGLTLRQERRLAAAIVREAHTHRLDPLLITAVIRIESTFDNFAVSHKGARGLMQIMPETGAWLSQRRGETLRSANHLFDFERNVALGTAYLRELIDRFGSEEAALLAYNAGPSYARRILAGPRETRARWLQNYPRKVLAEHARLRAALSGPSGAAERPPRHVGL